MSERTENTDDLNMRWLECLRIFQAKTQKAIEGNMRNPYHGHFFHPHGMPLPCGPRKDQRADVGVGRVIESRSKTLVVFGQIAQQRKIGRQEKDREEYPPPVQGGVANQACQQHQRGFEAQQSIGTL